MTELNFFSQNCNGLGNSSRQKRISIFRRHKRKGKAIHFFQETHSTKETETDFRSDFDTANLYFSHGTSNSNGVITAISKEYNILPIREINDINGRFLILHIRYENEDYVLANMYAPCRNFENNQIETLDNFIDHLNEIQVSNIILGGDWNLYLSPLLDKLDSALDRNDNPTYRNNLKSFLDTNNLVDAWRTIYPYEKKFTWYRGNQRSRLDYFFISEHLLNKLHKVEILPGLHSDHSLLNLSLDPSNKEGRGRGFWKFPENLLHDQEYVNKIKSLISAKINEYVMDDLGFKWDLIKMDIRNFTLPYCTHKKREAKKRETELNKKFLHLFSIVNTNNIVPQEILSEFYSVKTELENLEKDHARGIILRSKVQFVEEGEKCTSYFLRLEKNNYCNKHITKLYDPVTKEVVNDPTKILNMEKQFYENLYNDNRQNQTEVKENQDKIFNGITLPKISNEEKENCDKELSENEVLKAVKAMKPGKSPGTCGLTSEFYKFFWLDIKNMLVSSLNYNLKNGKLSVEQRRGILTLIPKKDKDRLYLKNWRPLTLLNTDYKILAKALANRLTKYLPFIIEDDQTGYISGRFMGCNIRLIEDIISQSSRLNIAGILLTIDFEKAFDSLKWSFIKKALKAFNFGTNFISYVSAMYNQISTAVINNGFTSSWFHPQRGVRQGCPLSPYLFIIAVEILATKIRQDKNIKGLIFAGVEIKISQLADDTTCFIKDETSLKRLLDLFIIFEKGTGLGINIDKTNTRCLGSFVPSEPNLFELKWTQNPVETLGVFVNGNENDHYKLNFEPKLTKMKQLFASWKCRKLSIKGKITVINTLAISKLIYLASIIKVPDTVFTEVKKLILDFIWEGKPAKIAYSTLIQGIEQGGLKLVDLETKVKSLRLTWIRRLCDKSAGKWKALPRIFFETSSLPFFFSCNSRPLNNLKGPKFYEQLQHYWCSLTNYDIDSADKVRNQIIWNNRFITIQNKPFLWQRWLSAGVYRINDILDDEGNFFNLNQMYEKYNIRTNFFELLQIRQSMPFDWRNLLRNSPDCADVSRPYFIFKREIFNVSKLKSKDAYQLLLKENNRTPTCVHKWQESWSSFVDRKEQIFKRIYLTTRETKLQSFQYHILHRTITCRKRLFDMRLINSNLCEICSDTIDTLPHFFLECRYIQEFWNSIKIWLCSISNDFDAIFQIDWKNILFGLDGCTDLTNVCNYIIVYAKYFIYRHRVQGDHHLALRKFKLELRYKLSIERAIAKKNKTSSFNKFVHIYNHLLDMN